MTRQPEKVSVAVVIEPVVYDDVPCAIVIGERRRVPPVLVKHPVGEAQHLSESIEPAVQKGVETQH